LVTNLKGKKVLITAGPTWVPIDNVRVISNTATGKTGMLLAKNLAEKGAKVTLILGPVESCCTNEAIKVINFKFFDELNSLLINEIKNKHYDIIIQTAAVSDYRPVVCSKSKLSSIHKKLNLALKPTPKIIDSLRKESPGSFLIGFKFEPGLAESKLKKEARLLMKRAHLDLTVANSIHNNNYIAYLVASDKEYGPFLNKDSMAKGLISLMEKQNAGN